MPRSEVSQEAVIAAGNACLGLGQAIAELARSGLSAEAHDLSTQFALTAKAIRWLTREDREEKSGDLAPEPKVGPCCEWMRGVLEGRKKKSAGEILSKGVEAGFTKSDIFAARESLGIVVDRTTRGQVWSLPA